MSVISALYVYPIKSLGGIALQKSQLDERGLQFDRRWMIVDKNGILVTQHRHPSLALLQTAIEGDKISIRHKVSNDSTEVPLSPLTKKHLTVKVWDDVCQGVIVCKTINEWLGDYLHERVRLIHMPDSVKRPVDKRYAKMETYTSFADGFPFLLIGEASLGELNRRAKSNLGMDRFRPNIVVKGTLPGEEEYWRKTKIGNDMFTGVKQCGRCMLTTIDQSTGKKGKEPLKTLATYKKKNGQLMFGRYMVYNGGTGCIKVGDDVSIKSRERNIQVYVDAISANGLHYLL